MKNENPLAYVGQKVIIEIAIPGHKRFKLEAPIGFTVEKVVAAIEEIMEQRAKTAEKPFDPIADNPKLKQRDENWKRHQQEMTDVVMP